MLDTPFSPWPCYTSEEADAVRDVLLSNKVNYWTGSHCRQFEKEYAAFAGTEYAVAVSNGTVALELALRAVGIGAGDEVIVPSRTFLASASSIVAAGAVPVFADVEADSQNISVNTIEPMLTDRTRAIICVHLAGWPCDMAPIMELADKKGLFVIEDCAQAHGAKYHGQSVGSLGHIGCWSFCQDKIMTTGGEGGMVTTNDKNMWLRMWSYKDHGKSWDAVYNRTDTTGFRWLHESFGSNWRMTEMQAVIGRIQLRRMDEWHKLRITNARKIWSVATLLQGLRVSALPDEIVHAAYKCYVFVDPKQLNKEWSRDRIMEAINERGVPCYSGTCSEVYLEKAFDNTKFRPKKRLPVAKELGENSLMFLVHPTLTDQEIEKTCEALKEIITLASR